MAALVVATACLLATPLTVAWYEKRTNEEVFVGHKHTGLELIKYPSPGECNDTVTKAGGPPECVIVTYAECKHGYSSYSAVLTNSGFVEKTRGYIFDSTSCHSVRNATVPDNECYVRPPGVSLPRYCRAVVATDPEGRGGDQTNRRELRTGGSDPFCEWQMPAGCCNGHADIGLFATLKGFLDKYPDEDESWHVHFHGGVHEYSSNHFDTNQECDAECGVWTSRFGRVHVHQPTKDKVSGRHFSYHDGNHLYGVEVCDGQTVRPLVNIGMGEISGVLTVYNSGKCAAEECAEGANCCETSSGDWLGLPFGDCLPRTTTSGWLFWKTNLLLLECGNKGESEQTRQWGGVRIQGSRNAFKGSGKRYCNNAGSICRPNGKCSEEAWNSQKRAFESAGKYKHTECAY